MSIGSGVTGNTSATVSALQGTTLSTIARGTGPRWGAVVEDVARLAEGKKIDCALDRRPAVTYVASPDELEGRGRRLRCCDGRRPTANRATTTRPADGPETLSSRAATCS